MLGLIGALAGPIIGAGASLLGMNRADKAADEAARAAQYAAQQQAAGYKKAEQVSTPFYNQARGDVEPYLKSGASSAALLDDITGVNGPDAQERALAMYQGSPLARLLSTAREEAVRRTGGEMAANGLLRSGAMTESLGRRLSDMDVTGFGNWQSVPLAMFGQGGQAAGSASQLAQQRGTQLGNWRIGKGAAQASGTIGAANAQLAGGLAGSNYLANLGGRLAGTDFSRFKFPSFGTDWAGGSGGAAP